jgi:hypothetical protein
MSSINSLFGGVGTLNPYASNSPVNRGADSDGDNDGSRGARGIGKGGAFSSAIMQALSQIGVTGVSSTSSTSGSGSTATSTSGTSSDGTTGSTSASGTDPQQALQTFMHDLFAALHAQGAQNTTAGTGTDSDGDNDGSGASSASGTGGGRHYHGGLSKIENSLQNLIQQLSSTDTSSTASASGSTDSALQQDFQNLITAMGGTGNQASLSDFLKSIATNLQNGSNPGLNISASA